MKNGNMLKILRQIIPENSWIRLFYSWAKAILAQVLYANPGKNLIIIGVTGTDGKTTTTHFTAELLEKLGMKVAMSSTENIWINGKHMDNTTKRTTLSPFVIQKFLKKAKENKCEVVIIEVSSHALVQKRVLGINFSGAIITNISQEHGNYHHSLLDYAQVKSQLFHLVAKSKTKNKILVVNKNMQFYDLFAKICPKITKTYALNNHQVDLTATNIKLSNQNSKFNIKQKVNNKNYNTVLNVAGEYNIENALAAMQIALFFKFSLAKISEQIQFLSSVPGRLEEIKISADFKVYIDFALTPGALDKLLTHAKATTIGKVILVFGCTGGHHDHSKRPIMGEIASKKADIVILTEDENYGEDNFKIMNEIEAGFLKNFTNYQKINDRKEAIYLALKTAKINDCVLITGMGAFTSRNNGQNEIKWSDKDCVLDFLLTEKFGVYNKKS